MILKFFYEIQFNILNFTALQLAVQNGHANIVKILLEQPGIDVNCRTVLFQKFMQFSIMYSLIMIFLSTAIYAILIQDHFIIQHCILQPKMATPKSFACLLIMN